MVRKPDFSKVRNLTTHPVLRRLLAPFRRVSVDWQARVTRYKAMHFPALTKSAAHLGRAAWDFGKTLVIAFLLAQLIMVSVAQAFQVEQFSMEPTLLPNDRVLVAKFIYRIRPARRGDVIVLRYPLNQSRNYIKRIVALPGEQVRIKDGRVLISGRAITEPYINGQFTGEYGPQGVPDNEYFVLGDNRNNSEDSRAFGFVKKDLVVGQALLIYWPPRRARVLIPR
ncbi:MAG: signal peptidase I [Armatimonadetes bacterium]|nr:signal peptidase I [Armatimonadota bacterium]